MFYWEYTVPNYTDSVFNSLVHMTRRSMEKLCQRLAPFHLFVQKNGGGCSMIPIEKQVAILVWYFATKETINNDQTISATFTSIRRVAKAIQIWLTKDLIYWQPIQEESAKLHLGFMKSMVWMGP